MDSELVFTTGGLGLWQRQTGSPSYYDGDCAQSGGTNDGDESWMQTAVTGAGTVTFWWKVSSESGGDYLEFYLDSQLQNGRISGEVGWTQKSCTITTSGTHTLRWRYVKDGSSSFGDDCGWVDWVQWSGPLPEPAADAWGTLNYFHDAGGRRIEKRCDGRTITKYVYDGDHCIAEYDAGGNLRRKYIYGPGIDQPICMIEATQSYAGTYYYHYDGLGSVTALSDGDGNTVEVYEYDVYGRVGASDANHPNRFLFTGREYDKETGLYYYRARYYNPQIGRFLQTDPIGYRDGMNWYRYCRNNGVNLIDPHGLVPQVCIVIGQPDKDDASKIIIGSALDESVNDWDPNVWAVSGTMDSILNAIKDIESKYRFYQLSIQGDFFNDAGKSGTPAFDVLSEDTATNPVLQILQAATRATKIDWRNFALSDTQGTHTDLNKMTQILNQSQSKAQNTFVVDTGLNQEWDAQKQAWIIVDDTGQARGYEGSQYPAAPRLPNADYNIYGAVYSFTYDAQNKTYTSNKDWVYIPDDPTNNQKQPY